MHRGRLLLDYVVRTLVRSLGQYRIVVRLIERGMVMEEGKSYSKFRKNSLPGISDSSA